MTAETPNPKPQKKPSLLILAAICLGNFAGLFYLYQQHQQDTVALKNILKTNALVVNDFKAAISKEILQKSQINAEINLIKQNIAQQALEKHDDSLLKIEWLLQQAEWQMNILKQVRYAKGYLKQAKNLASHLGFHGIADSIHHDLMRLKQENITPSHQILETILEIQQHLNTLENLNLQTNSLSKPAEVSNLHPKLQTMISLLKPFIKIERYHQIPAKILTPDDKTLIVQNLKLILAEIQYAMLSGQQNLVQQLLNQFTQEAQMLSEKDALNRDIDKLKAIHIGLEKPLHLSSLSMTQQLIKESKA